MMAMPPYAQSMDQSCHNGQHTGQRSATGYQRLVEIVDACQKWGGIQGFLNDKNRTMTYMRSILQLLARQ